MATTIVDDEVTGCRLVHEWHGNKDSAEQLLLSIPKSAIALQLTPLFMPWGTYTTKTVWGKAQNYERKPGSLPRNAHHSPEKREAVTIAANLWREYRQITKRPTIAKFMLMCGRDIPEGVTAVDIKRRTAFDAAREKRVSERMDTPQAKSGRERRLS